MRIFEFIFNPPSKKQINDYLFDAFYYEPKDTYEKKLGNLYVIGEITNLLPQNNQFLDQIAKVVKEKYYSFTLKDPTESFREALGAVNEFLAKEVSKNNVSWLGNSHIAIFSLISKETERIFNLSKVGKIKVFLESRGRINQISKRLDFEDIEPYPLKIFTKSINVRIGFEDKIAIFTPQIAEFFLEKNLLEDFFKLDFSQEEKVKDFFKEKKISGQRGILFFIELKKEISKSTQLFTIKKELESFSFRKAFSPFFNFLAIVRNKLLIYRRKPLLFKLEEKQSKNFLNKFLTDLKERIYLVGNIKSNLISLFLLISILTIGFFIFQKEERKNLERKENILLEAEQNLKKAENLFSQRKEEEAFRLLKESLDKIIPLSQEDWQKKEETLEIQKKIEEKLSSSSHLEIINNPSIFFEFNANEFIPQKIIYSKGAIFSFSPFERKLFKIDLKTKEKEEFTFDEDSKASLAINYQNNILFFIKPDKLISFEIKGKNSNFGKRFTIQTPYPDFDFIAITSYLNNIYFLEEKKGEIIRYSPPFQKEELWLRDQTKKIKDGKSITSDGSIWVLKENHQISQYFKGEHQKDLNFNFFPFPKKIQKILTSPQTPFLFLLEPHLRRVIILDKKGKVIKQFKSEEFDNLKDFSFSPENQTLYILNGSKIYQLKIQ
jgi:hypothetical protein